MLSVGAKAGHVTDLTDLRLTTVRLMLLVLVFFSKPAMEESHDNSSKKDPNL